MSKRYFISATAKNDNGFMMCSAGCSAIDNEDYVVTTNYLKSDEVPDTCSDAKGFTELVAGLLNAFYNSVDVSNMEEDAVRLLGIQEAKLNIPSPENPQIPF